MLRITKEVKSLNYKNLCECGCGQVCKNKFILGHNCRIKHPNWKSDIKIHQGYILVRKKYHPYCDYKGFVKLHRIIYEIYLSLLNGIRTVLHPSILVHHKDGNIQNNSIQNLELVTRSNHMSIHFKKDLSNRFCLKCGATKTYVEPKTKYEHWFKYSNGFECRRCHVKK